MPADSLVVKANILPVRALTLKKLRKELGRRGLGVDAGQAFFLDAEAGAQHGFMVASPESLVARLWMMLLGELEALTRAYSRIARAAADCGASHLDVAEVYADLLAYALRWPLYLHPRPQLGVTAPHLAIPLIKIAKLLGADPSRVPFYHWYRLASSLASGDAGAGEVASEIAKSVKEESPCKQRLDGEVLDALGEVMAVLAWKLEPIIEFALYTVPADTRPGLNLSPLTLHDLLASAIAVARLRSRGAASREAVAALRLAALLHDIGKPLNYRAHVRRSVEEARRLMKALLEELRGTSVEEGLSRLADVIVSLVEHHHDEEGCRRSLGPEWVSACEALRYGDQMASAVDRLTEVIVSCAAGGGGAMSGVCESFDRAALERLARELAKELGVERPEEALRVAYITPRGASARAWEAWRRVWLKSLTDKELRRTLVNVTLGVLRLVGGIGRRLKPSGEDGDVCVVVVDIGGVQRLIRESSKLRVLAGMSLAVDYATMVGVPLALEALGAPLEAVVFAGGASAQAIVSCRSLPDGAGAPEGLANRLRDELVRVMGGLAARLVLGEPEVRAGASEMKTLTLDGGGKPLPLYGASVEEAHRSLSLAKSSPRPVPPGRPSLTLILEEEGEGLVCTSCRRRPAIVAVKGERFCLRCYARYTAFSSLGFASRARRIAEAFGLGAKEVIPQEPAEALTYGGAVELAVVKTDANAMGLFMASSLTPAAFFEKSVRVDLALKRGLQALYEAVHEASRRRAASILAHSYLYAGGDDALILLPSKASLPAAFLLAYTFAAELGFKATLSVGLAAGPAEQPVWWLLEAAEELLSEAKSAARGDAVSTLKGYPNASSSTGGSVMYDYTPSGALTSLRVRGRLSRRPLRGAVSLLLGRLGALRVAYALAYPQEAGWTPGIPSSEDDDKSLLNKLKGLLKDSMDSPGRVGDSYRDIARLAAAVRGLEALPWASAASAGESDGDSFRALAVLLANLKAVAGRLSGDEVGGLLTEIYLISKLSGG